VTVAHPTTSEADRPPTDPLPILARYWKFLLVGLTGVVVNLVVFSLTIEAISPHPTFDLYANLWKLATTTTSNPVDNLIASAVAFAVATLWNFALNNVWTFRSKAGHRHRLTHRLGLYYGVSLGSLAVNEVVLFVASLYIAPLFGQALGIVVGSIVGFVGNRRYTFAEADRAP
jgi:putative flippase GtrA